MLVVALGLMVAGIADIVRSGHIATFLSLIASLIAVSAAVLGVALRLRPGLLGPRSPAWRNGLLCAVLGVAVAEIGALVELCLVRHVNIWPLGIMIFGVPGALGGAVGGLLWSFGNYLDRSQVDQETR
jgi:hypothetical protein